MVAPFGEDGVSESLIKHILIQNSQQSSLQFELLKNTMEIERDFAPGERLDMEELRAALPKKLERYRRGENLPPNFPIAILAPTSFTNNFYVLGDGTWAVIALYHWIEKDGVDFASLLFMSRLIRASITFGGVLGLEAHTSTLSCIFDKTVKIDEAEFSVRSGFLCADCASVVSDCISSQFTADVRFLLAAVAERARILPDSALKAAGQNPDDGRPVASNLFKRYAKPILDYLLATTYKRVLTTVMGFGVVLLSGLEWQDVAAILVSNVAGGPNEDSVTFVQLVGLGMIVLSILGHTWIHLAEKRSERKQNEGRRNDAYAELIGEVSVLTRAYEDSSTKRPGGYFSETIKHCSIIAHKVSEVGETRIKKNPTLRKLMNPQIDASGQNPLFNASVVELREFVDILGEEL